MYRWLLSISLILLTSPVVANVTILLPLGRTAYQTNEWIDVSVVRSATNSSLPESLLTLSLQGADGSSVATTFAAPAAGAQRTEHLHLNGWLLRPGKYTLEVDVDGVKKSTDIEIVSHVRQSSFRLINWGRAKEQEQLLQGESSLGFNLYYGDESKDNLLRAGVDAMGVCVMSGGHQMDLRLECDWSDPLVVRGGTRRVVRRALADRTRPNVNGVHFYDEPGLTWHMHPVTKQFTPHEIPAQIRSYRNAFDKEPLEHHKLDPKNPEHAQRWKHWITWKLGFMDAAWKDSQFGVSQVRPDYLSLTQSQYGWSAFTDGYYFNVNRSLPITSGHGGYHDFGPGFFNPSLFLEMARARDQWKPSWYLPTWYGNTTSDQFRLEQYLAFQTGIQGMMSPPDLEPASNPSARQGIVESNHVMKKLGPIFTTMPATKPPVAMLYSLSQAMHTQFQSKATKNYTHEVPHGQNLTYTYLAGKLSQQPFLPVLDEDVIDGSVANDHKAIILTSMDYASPQVVQALEDFASGGGLVLLTGDSTIAIKGAKKLSTAPKHPDADLMEKLQKDLAAEKDAKAKDFLQKKLSATQRTGRYLAGALPLAKEIQGELAKAGIRPIVESNVPTIVATRHVFGEIEYIFLVNATPDDDAIDAKGNPERVTPKAVQAKVALPVKNGSAFVYDAMTGGPIDVQAANANSALASYGPGQMRVLALTKTGIGGIKLAPPAIARDLVLEQAPIRVEIAATLQDVKGRVLAGSAPLHLQIIDPLGAVRHELYQSTRLGQFSTSLPLAANDPAGNYVVVARDLLTNKEDRIEFEYRPPVRARAIAGATHRAVSFGNDRDNVFRFGRTHRSLTIVKGKSAFNDAAAKRLAKILEPWGIQCKEMDLVEAAKARKLSDEEAVTWVGLAYAGKGQLKSGDINPPVYAGFAVQGPVILLGNPEDHPILAFLHKEKFLPYAPEPNRFPGADRGMLAWQRDGVGAGQESVALIAYDEAGMSEAVGSLYEAIAGIEPLTKWQLPTSDRIKFATKGTDLAGKPKLIWKTNGVSGDRIIKLSEAKGTVIAYGNEGSIQNIRLKGDDILAPEFERASEVQLKQLREEPPVKLGDPLAAVVKKQTRPDRLQKLAVAGKDMLAIAYWGGTFRIVDPSGQIRAEDRLDQDIAAMTWIGPRLVVGLADGRVMAFEVK